MAVSVTLVCLDLSQSKYRLYKQIKSLHSTGVPKLTPGYGTASKKCHKEWTGNSYLSDFVTT